MVHRKLTIVALVFLLVAGISVSACAPAPDLNKHGVQGIAQAIPAWEQVNGNGFGDQQTVEVSALAGFNSYLYAGTTNPIAGARIFRSPDGATWTPATQPGFGISHDIAPPSILDLEVFNGRLYASTGRGDGPGQIWRTLDGVNWAPMVIAGFGNPDTVDITALAVYNNMIYAGAINLISGAQIWRSFSGDSNTWTQVAPGVSGTAATNITGLAVFNGALYAAVESNAPAQLWRTTTGGTWTTVMNNGFGNSLTKSTGGMAVFGGYLYVGAENAVDRAQLWRSNEGASWEQAINPGLGDPNNQKVEMVFVFQNQLYIGVRNAVTGLEVWRSPDGMNWEQTNPDGFGDSNNSGTNWSNATTDFLSQLYVGTSNVVGGGELWRMLQQPPDVPTATDTPTPAETLTPSATATDTPTDIPTITPTPTDTPTLTPTNTATDTPTETPTLTYTPTNTLTDTPTATQTATNTATDTPAFTPTDTPTSTPIFSTPGRVTGGGVIDSDAGGVQITFGLTVNYNEGDAGPQGNLTYQDHKTNLRLKATSFELLVIEGSHVWLTGTGILNDWQIVNFEVQVNALSKQSQPDTFNIYIAALNGYEAGGTLTGGNLTIHK